MTDEEIGTSDLYMIMPDTWKNISWVLQDSVSQIIERCIKDSRRIECVRKYSTDHTKELYNYFLEMLEKGNADMLKF